MLKTLIFVWITIEAVICGPDLCKNGIRLDSITYVDKNKMYFFTSGGHYWYIKENEMPPKGQGTPLPKPFTRGDAAFFKNTLLGCGNIKPKDGKTQPNEQEIHLIEFINGDNQVIILDVRTGQWSEPKLIENYRDLKQAKVDWRKKVDAAFVHQITNIAIIQGNKYSLVDIKPLCEDPDAYGESKTIRKIETDFNHQNEIQAMTSINDTNLLLFSEDSFWKMTKRFYASEGKIHLTKGHMDDPGTGFFHFDEDCKLPPTEGGEPPEATPDAGPVGNADTQSPPPGGEEGNVNSENAEQDTTTEPGGGFPWIIIVIVVIVIILLAIILIACMAMRKKDKTEANKAAEPEAGVAPGASKTGSQTGAAGPGSKATSSTVGNTMSVRSNANTTSPSGSKAGSKTGAGGGTKGASGLMGTSPSTMSVRSNANLTTSNTSKAGSKAKSKT